MKRILILITIYFCLVDGFSGYPILDLLKTKCDQNEIPVNICQDIVKLLERNDGLIGTDTNNIVTVPTNCPEGQELINGKCRQVWKTVVQIHNVVTAPPNCPDGQEFINGKCRDIWRQNTRNRNVANAPPNCPSGHEFLDGECREVWSKSVNKEMQSYMDVQDHAVTNRLKPVETVKNIVSVPNQCPEGYKPDANGVCRELWFRWNQL